MPTTIPITVAPDAEAHAANLGMQRELEQMVQHALQTAPGLHEIRVTLEFDPEFPDAIPQLVIWAHRDEPPSEAGFDPTDWDWGGGKPRPSRRTSVPTS